MLYSLKLNSKEFKFGITKVFFRPGKFIEFDRIMKSDPENLKAIVANVKKWLVRSRWIKSMFCAICVIKSKSFFIQIYLIFITDRLMYKHYLCSFFCFSFLS